MVIRFLIILALSCSVAEARGLSDVVAKTCAVLAASYLDTAFLEGMPVPPEPISSSAEVREKAKAILLSDIDFEEKGRRIYHLYIEERIKRVPEEQRAQVRTAVENIRILEKAPWWAHITHNDDDFTKEFESHASNQLTISIERGYTVLQITFADIVAHEMAHIIQFTGGLKEKVFFPLRAMDSLFTPMPRVGRRRWLQEHYAIHESWDLLNLFSVEYRREAVARLKAMPQTFHTRHMILSLEASELSREEFVGKLHVASNYTRIKLYAPEIVMKGCIYGFIIMELFSW